MKYALRVLALGHSKHVSITEEQFHAIEKARGVLSSFSRFTENYRVVLDAYQRVESARHDIALSHILHGFSAYTGTLNVRVILNSTLIGYLAAARYFIDSSDKLLPALLRPSEITAFKAKRSQYYDAKKEYRFVEELRNYVQHRALPVDAIKYHNFVEDTKSHATSDLVTAVSLFAMRDTLQADRKFKNRVLADMPPLIDITQCIRTHMEGLWESHDYVLKTHGELATEARSVIIEAREKFVRDVGGSLLGLHAVRVAADEHVTKELPLLLEWDDARIEALKNIGMLKNLHKRYVSGKIQKA